MPQRLLVLDFEYRLSWCSVLGSTSTRKGLHVDTTVSILRGSSPLPMHSHLLRSLRKNHVSRSTPPTGSAIYPPGITPTISLFLPCSPTRVSLVFAFSPPFPARRSRQTLPRRKLQRRQTSRLLALIIQISPWQQPSRTSSSPRLLPPARRQRRDTTAKRSRQQAT